MFKKSEAINAYPIIAKWLLISLAIICVVSFAGAYACAHIDGLRQSAWGSRLTLMGFTLILPLVAAGQFLNDPIDAVIKEYGISSDAALQQRIRALIPMIRATVLIGQFESGDINALAISSILRERSLVAFSSKMLEVAGDVQLCAFAAHEMAHVRNGDSKNKTYILALHQVLLFYPRLISLYAKAAIKRIFPIVVVLAIFLTFLLLFSSGERTALGFIEKTSLATTHLFLFPVLAVFGFSTLDFISKFIFHSYSREREFVADAEGAINSSVEAMIAALDLLSPVNESVGVFDTHPPTDKRKMRLLLMQKAK